MFRFLKNLVIALGFEVYKAVYKPYTKPDPASQTTHQPAPTPPKPEVVFGEPLTEEELRMLETTPRVLN